MSDAPNLIDKTGMGGVIAIDGFDYQRWDAICRIPAWLKNAAFEGLTVEALEDFEARFFSPHAVHSHVLERFQAKSGHLTRGDIVEVFENFKTYDTHYPNTALIQTLVTPALPPALRWLERDAGRIERARRFYQPFTDITDANDGAFQTKLEAEFSGDLGRFVAKNANIFLRSLHDQSAAASAFSGELHKAYPEFDFGMRSVQDLFQKLNEVLANAVGEMVGRAVLIDLFSAVLPELLISQGCPVRILSVDQPGEVDCIDIDGRPFSGGDLAYPPPDVWKSKLLKPLNRAAEWCRVNGHTRIVLSGRYRLSTGFAIGAAFRSALGFEIEIPTRDGSWNTDSHPIPGKSYPELSIEPPEQLFEEKLLVAIGCLRDPTQQVEKQLTSGDAKQILRIHLPEAITSAEDTQASVQSIKMAISCACGKFNVNQIDCYFAGPTALAIALGHRWNGLPPTQLHEFVASENDYVPTLQLT